MNYNDFLQTKICLSTNQGFTISLNDINPILYPHQKDIVQWAIAGGRRAIFAAFGLGKSFIQLECLRIIQKKEQGKQLIITPLGVRHEFKIDAEKLGISITFVRRTDEVSKDGIYITNYESVRDGRLDVNLFNGVTLDEASCLRSYGSKTYQEFLMLFKSVKYRFVATATPSPNKYKELIHYGGFLGIMDTGQALTRFFKRDSTQANNLTLHPAQEKEFWLWMSSWAIFLQKPSDLGYSDEGYDLPKLIIHKHMISTSVRTFEEKDGQMKLFPNPKLNLHEASREKRDSINERVAKMLDIISNEIYIKSLDNQQGECYDKSRIPSCLLSQKSRKAVGGTKIPEQEKLSSEQTKIQRSKSAMEREQSRKIQSSDKKALSKKHDCCKREKPPLVSVEQRKSIERKPGEETTEIWIDNRNIQTDGFKPEQQVQNMWERNEPSDDRSLSQDKKGMGPTLPTLQHGDWFPSGRYNSSSESNKLFEQFIVWCDLNDEQKDIDKALKSINCSFVSLYGNDDIDKREIEIAKWKNKEKSAFVSKPQMYGSGINMQQCHHAIFIGIGFKFNDWFQAIARVYRFLQDKECHIHLIYTDTEIEVLKTLMEKWENHKRMVEKMSEIIRKYGLSHSEMAQELKRTIGIKRIESRGEKYIVANNDCIEEVKLIEENSIDLVHTSIPFGNHYEYTASYNDFGHNSGNETFFNQMDFLVPDLLRILKPGRVAAIHVKDRIEFGNTTGYGMPSVDPFHCLTINNFRKHGFIYMGMITVVTDVVRENNQTYRLGWTEQCKDGSKMGVGCPEYILLFRKLPSDNSRAYADDPVIKSKKAYSRSRWQIDAHDFWRSSGERFLTAEEMAKYPVDVLSRVFTEESLKHIYNYQHHVKIGEELDLKGCLPSSFMVLAPGSHCEDVWHDICRMRTLNGEQTAHGLNNHICPLQFDIVDRIVNRYSNIGDTVFDPFGGIMTVPYRAILAGRKGRAVELNTEYFFDGLKYLEAAEINMSMGSLFDFENIKTD